MAASWSCERRVPLHISATTPLREARLSPCVAAIGLLLDDIHSAGPPVSWIGERRIDRSRASVGLWPPQSEILDLLFAESYGIALVRPSMQETAAWVAISMPQVATIIAKISPFLLLTAGDPASLPLSTRSATLAGCVNLLASNLQAPILDHDSVTRFAQPDLCDVIRKLWAKHSDMPTVQKFLLRLIWLGRLNGCSDIANATAFSDSSTDPSLTLFAARAVCASADENTKKCYKEHVISRLGQDRNATVWTLVEELFQGLWDIRTY